MREKKKTPLDKFYRRHAHNHIFFGLAMAASHYQRPLAEAIAIYRERTGDNETEDKRLYQMREEMTEAFKLASDGAVRL